MPTFSRFPYGPALLLGLSAALAQPAAAQLNLPAANAQNIAGTYTDLGTGGTAIATANQDDANSAPQPIGFNFPFAGVAGGVSSFVLNTNGFLSLAGTAPSAANQFLTYAQVEAVGGTGPMAFPGGPLAGPDNFLVMPFATDLMAASSGPAEYRYLTTGTAPNRVCTVQWKNVKDKPRPINSTTPALLGTQYDNFSFQARLYEGGQVEFVYGPATAAGRDDYRTVLVGLKGAGTADVVVTDKQSRQVWSTATFLDDAYVNVTDPHNVRSTVLPDAGRTYRFSAQMPNDVAPQLVQTLTQLPIPQGAPHAVRALVVNRGTTNQANIQVTLTVSGANAYTATQTIASLPLGPPVAVTFAAFTPTNPGTNTVTVSTPPDDNNVNNSLSVAQVVNATTYAYADPGNSSTGSRGYGTTSAYNVHASRFATSIPLNVTQVRAFLVNGATGAGATEGKTVFGVLLDAAGNVLARSADYVVSAGDINTYVDFPLATLVNLPAGRDFFVGLAQTYQPGQAQYFALGTQPDGTGRPSTFYAASTTQVLVPFDLSQQAFASKLMIAAVTAPATLPAQDAGIAAVLALTQLPIPQGAPHEVRAVVTNFGSAVLANLPVTLTVTGANAFATTQTVAALAPGASTTVRFAGFTPTATGTNTLAVTVPPDGLNTNNSRSVSQQVNTTTFSYADPRITARSTGYGSVGPDAVACRYRVGSPARVTQVRSYLTTAAPSGPNSTIGQTVYGVVVNAATNALLARSADHVVTAADIDAYVSLPLSTPVALPAGTEVYVGMVQVYGAGLGTDPSTRYYPFGAQPDEPGRTDTFYGLSIANPAAPVATPTAYRYMIEAVSQAVLGTRNAALAAQVGLYPNPAHGAFAVMVPAGLLGAATATLLNALGQVVRQRPLGLPATGGTASFDVRGLPAGVYSLQLLNGETLVVKRVVVE